MAVSRAQKNNGYTVMSNTHLQDRRLTLKAKGLFSIMLSLPEKWNYSLKGLSNICLESVDSIREGIKELETAGYITRSRERDKKGRLLGACYNIIESPSKKTTLEKPCAEKPITEKPITEKPILENPTLEKPTQ